MKNIKVLVESTLLALVGFLLTNMVCSKVGMTGLSAFNLTEGVAGLVGIGSYIIQWLILLRRSCNREK